MADYLDRLRALAARMVRPHVREWRRSMVAPMTLEPGITTGPLLSVILPALNADRELRRCVDSVHLACAAKLTYEIVIVTPLRVDGTGFLASDELDKVRFVTETRKGIYGAMNDGIASSCGRFLYFLGQDDIVLPAFGSAASELASETAVSALIFDVYWGDRGVYRGHRSRWSLLWRNLCHQGVIYSRAIFSRHGLYLRRMTVQADHLLNIRVLWDSALQQQIRYIHRPLAWYSASGYSISRGGDPVFRRLYPLIIRRYAGPWASRLLVGWRCVRGRVKS